MDNWKKTHIEINSLNEFKNICKCMDSSRYIYKLTWEYV